MVTGRYRKHFKIKSRTVPRVHVRGSHTGYNLNSATGQTDCPRFTERRDWARNRNTDNDRVPASAEEAVIPSGEKLEMLSILITVTLVCAHYPQGRTAISTSEVTSDLSIKADQPDQQQKNAERVWEQAIAAKGGRERLYAVSNMVISTRKDTTGVSSNTQVRREELLVFPNQYWFWDDYRPNVFGVSVHMYNYDNNTSSVFSDDKTDHTPRPTTDSQGRKALRNDQLSFLLESKWLKPKIVRASTATIGVHAVDIVQTIVEGERVDFAFDRETHLPIRVSYYDVLNGNTYINVQSFSNYVDIAGMKVPQTIEYNNGSKYKASFKFNVEYDENIFINPPPIEAGPEAWRLEKR